MNSQIQSPKKKICEYGDKCYRKNPTHFQEYEHPHLNDLLKSLDRSKSETLSSIFTPKINKDVVREQVKILKKLSNASAVGNTSVELSPLNSPAQTDLTINLQSSTRKRQGEANFESYGKKQQLEKKVESKSTTRQSDKEPYFKMADLSTLSSKEHKERMQRAKNMSEAMKFFEEVKKRSQGNICEKHKAAAPYYFFLTSITDSNKTHSEPLSLQLFDILDPSLGDLESSLQINFMVEFGWLMAHYHVAKQRGKPITLLYGEMDVNNLDMKHVTAVKVKPPSPFGSHHTKMCVLAYTDGSVRVCVHTANLVESDWDNRVQGVWLSPLCSALPLTADTDSGESPTYFKHDLIQYLTAYRLPELQPWIGKLRRADFSHINVFFVASTPGSHKGPEANRWGHSKLSSLLSSHASIPFKSDCPPSRWQIIAQSSSIGSLGPQPTSWFCGEIKQTMSRGVAQSLQSPPPIRLVYPSFENVAASHDGLLGGGCLPYSRKTHDKQPWLQQYLYQWKSDARHRTKAMPHIKTYTRVSPDLSHIAWFHLTSANLSKAAWGSLTKTGAISILNYEAGVLFLPKFVLGPTYKTFPIKGVTSDNTPVFPMPYDLPLTNYTSRDVPWFFENLG